jgi:polyhydroxybutyrate depolymerase
VKLALLVLAACHGGEPTVEVGQHTRSYRLFVPTDKPGMPLVIVLHGGDGTGRQMEKWLAWDGLAASEQFVVAYPDGIDHHWNDGRPGRNSGAEDVAFVAALIDELAAKHQIDRSRVYVTGMSNGGIMSYRLGCDLADRIAAIAPVAGDLAQALATSCHPARPISVLAIHGTDDPLVPYRGGESPQQSGLVLSEAESTRLLAAGDGCGPPRAPVDLPDRDPGDGTRAHAVDYDCPPPLAVRLVTIDGGGHTWPGASQYLPKAVIGRVSRDFDATETIWQFFVEHGRRP